jgi:hypothetical protein
MFKNMFLFLQNESVFGTPRSVFRIRIPDPVAQKLNSDPDPEPLPCCEGSG